MEELKDRYEIIEEAASDAIVTIDEQGRILSISRAAERIFGHSVPDMVGQPVDRIIPNYKQYVEEARHRGKNHSVVEVSGVHKSGKQVQLELSLGEYNKNNKHTSKFFKNSAWLPPWSCRSLRAAGRWAQ